MKTHKFQLVNVDTDAISFCNEDMSPISHEVFEGYLDEINDFLPELIEMENDGEFESFVVVKAKNYVMRYFDPKKDKLVVKKKGGSLLDSKKEPAMLLMVDEICRSLLNGVNYTELQEIYLRYITESVNVKDIKRWCQKKTITKAVLDCETNPDARLQERKLWDVMQGKGLSEGDKIYVYDYLAGEKQKVVKGELVFKKSGEPTMVDNIILKTADDFDNDTHDQKLVQRVWSTFDIFKTILDMKKFPKYHNKTSLPKLLELKE